jgi:hypothetical protein
MPEMFQGLQTPVEWFTTGFHKSFSTMKAVCHPKLVSLHMICEVSMILEDMSRILIYLVAAVHHNLSVWSEIFYIA